MMPKSQYWLLAGGVLAVISLALLPKSVVKTKEKNLAEPTATVAPLSGGVSFNADSAQSLSEVHSTKFSPEQELQVQQLRRQFAQASNLKAKRQSFDSLASLFYRTQYFDSVAYYAETLATAFPSVEHDQLTADAFFEAFNFAIDPQKARKLAEKTRSFYSKVLEKQPNNPDAQVKLAVTYTVSENPMQGIQMIRKVLEQNPDNQTAIYHLGMLSMQSGQYPKAIERFERLLQLNPQDVRNHLLLAECFAKIGKKQQAIEQINLLKGKTQESSLLMLASDFLRQLQ